RAHRRSPACRANPCRRPRASAPGPAQWQRRCRAASRWYRPPAPPRYTAKRRPPGHARPARRQTPAARTATQIETVASAWQWMAVKRAVCPIAAAASIRRAAAKGSRLRVLINLAVPTRLLPAMSDALTYRAAGVDIDAGNAVVERIKPLVKR